MKTQSEHFEHLRKRAHIEPQIVIGLRSLRSVPVDMLLINSKENADEETLLGIVRAMKELVFENARIIYSTSSFRLKHISAGNTFSFAIYKHSRSGHFRDDPEIITYDLTIWDDVRGSIFSKGFTPDEEGKIPREFIREIDKRLADFTRRGIVYCRRCKKEFKHWNKFGMYRDSNLCSEECAKASEQQERDRSR